LVVAGCLAAAGCTGGGGETSAAEEGGRSTYSEHEHHTPEHKPASLPRAVRELRRRHAELVEHRSRNQAAERSGELQQVLDIVGWLPELAADSDLRKSDWDTVNESSKRLEGLFAASNATDASAGEAARLIEQELAALQELVERERERFDPERKESHAHDHHHHR
jgi:hypothetical protein